MLFSFLRFFFLMGYIAPSNSYPTPLSPKEEGLIIERTKKGDEEARNILIERNLRLVAHIAKKYNNHVKDIEDLLSVGDIGLIKAISSYELDKNTRFATYASRCINNEILMYLRSGKKHSNNIYLQEPIGVDKEGNEVTIEDKVADNCDSIDEQVNLILQTKHLYEKIKSVLKSRERIVIQMRYGLCGYDEVTQREIAEMLGISRSYISRIEKKALQKLRKEFEKPENP